MKNIICYLSLLIISITAIAGCKKMDSTYEQYIVPGGITYAGKANKAVAQPGKNRVRISWPKSSDPNVIKAKIFWNNFMDSVELDIPSTIDTVSYLIDNLEEKTYSFVVKTYDNKGNVSVPVELITASYGVNYQASLINRAVNVNTVSANGNTVKITWGGSDITNGAFATELLYTNMSGSESILTIPANVSATTITDYQLGSTYKFRTLFRPDSLAMDVFNTPYEVAGDFVFDKTEWKIVAFSTQHDAGSNAVKNFIDGTDGTRWHSAAGPSRYPHFVTIDMGAVKTISRFGLWRTTFENGGDTRGPDKVQFLVSLDNVTWTDLGTYNFNRLINGEQSYPITNKSPGRYFKFVAVQGPENNLVLGEISAYGL